jgi:hypothetical protein
METEDVPEEYVDLLQTLIKMNVKPKGKNPQSISCRHISYVASPFPGFDTKNLKKSAI